MNTNIFDSLAAPTLQPRPRVISSIRKIRTRRLSVYDRRFDSIIDPFEGPWSTFLRFSDFDFSAGARIIYPAWTREGQRFSMSLTKARAQPRSAFLLENHRTTQSRTRNHHFPSTIIFVPNQVQLLHDAYRLAREIEQWRAYDNYPGVQNAS